MSQNNSNEKTSSSLDMIGTINQVPDFDPRTLAVNYTDLKTGETRTRLPVVAQIAWFRLKYPEGKIAVKVSPGTNCFVATVCVRTIKTPKRTFWLKRRLRAVNARKKRPCHPENGRRQQRSESRFAMQGLACSSNWRARISPRMRRTNLPLT